MALWVMKETVIQSTTQKNKRKAAIQMKFFHPASIYSRIQPDHLNG